MKQFKSILAAGALLISACGGSSLQAAIAGTFGAIGGASPEVLAINGATGATIDTEDLGGSAEVLRAAWSSDGSFLLVGGVGDTGGNEVHVFAFDGIALTEKAGAAVDVSSTVREVAWRGDDAFFATVDSLRCLRTYSFDPLLAGTSTLIDTETPPGINVLLSVDWHPDQSFIAVSAFDSTVTRTEIMIYAVDAGGMIGTQVEAVTVGTVVNSVRWSPDGNHLVAGGGLTGGFNLRLYSWDGSTTLTLKDSEVAGGTVNEVAWSPDGSHVAIGNSGTLLGEVRVYSFDSGLETLTLEDTVTFSNSTTTSVGWYPDGENILAGGNVDGTTGRYTSFAYDTGTESFTGTNWTVNQDARVNSVDVRPLPAKATCDCEIDDCLVTSFRGNFAVDPCRKLLANFIDPVMLNDETGNFAQDDGTEAITCFSGNVGVAECRTLLTNRICPVVDITLSDVCTVCDAGDRGCEENAAGCLELCGDQVIIAGKLLVNDFGPFDDGCLTKDGIRGEPTPLRFAGDVNVAGNLLAGGVNLSELVADMQLEIAQLKALLKN